MIIRFFINNKFEEIFTEETPIDEARFNVLAPSAKAWSQILKANHQELSALEGILNLVYYVQENIVLPRNFDQADFITRLSIQVYQISK